MVFDTHSQRRTCAEKLTQSDAAILTASQPERQDLCSPLGMRSQENVSLAKLGLQLARCWAPQHCQGTAKDDGSLLLRKQSPARHSWPMLLWTCWLQAAHMVGVEAANRRAVDSCIACMLRFMMPERRFTLSSSDSFDPAAFLGLMQPTTRPCQQGPLELPW